MSYGLWSLLAPVGYNRDPASPLGYANVKIVPEGLSALDADNALHNNQGKEDTFGSQYRVGRVVTDYLLLATL